MAKYIPKINLPLEAVEHARWLEKGLLAAQSLIDGIIRRLDAIEKQLAALGRRTSGTTVVEGAGIPIPTLRGGVLRGHGADGVSWTYEWQGLMPEYWVTLDPTNGSSYTVSDLGDGSTVALLPPVRFADDGATMMPIGFDSYPDSRSGGQIPIYLSVDLMPAADGDEFTIYVPDNLNFNGISVPYFKFQLTNPTAYSATVLVSGGGVGFDETHMFYAGTRIPVMGSLTSWTIEPGAFLAWHVEVHRGWGSSVTPVTWDDAGTARFADPYYDALVGGGSFAGSTQVFPTTVAGTATVGMLPSRFYNDTGSAVVVGKVRASVGTAPTGSDIEADVLVDGSPVGSVVIPAGTVTGTATLSGAWPADSLVTVEVTQVGSSTPGSDLTVQVWAG